MVVTDRGERLADHPAIPPLLALVGGITAVSVSDPFIRFIPLLVSLLPLALCRRKHLLPFLGVWFFALSWGCLHSWSRLQVPPSLTEHFRRGERVTVEGVVVGRLEGGEEFSRSVVEVTGKEPFRILLSHPGPPTLFIGERIRFTARLTPFEPLGLPGEPDPRLTMGLRGICARARLDSSDALRLEGIDPRFGFLRWVEGVRSSLVRRIDGAMTPETGAVARSIVLGDRSSLDEPVMSLFSRTGTSHLLAVSGLHVGIVAAGVILLLRLAGKRFTPLLLRVDLARWAPVASVPAVVAYLFLTGGAPSTLRSVAMFLFLALVLAMEREWHPIDLLASAAFVMLAMEPSFLYRPSFQLSFCAVWGIVVGEPLLRRLVRISPGSRWYPVVGSVTVTIAATIATLPLVIRHFGNLPLCALVANPLVVPLLGVVTLGGGLTGLLLSLPFPAAGSLVLEGVSLVISLALRILELCDRVPSPSMLHLPLLPLMVAYLWLMAITFRREGRILTGASVALTTAACSLAVAGRVATPPDSLRITFLSLGQAEATLIQTPSGRTVMIDAGGRPFGGSEGIARWRLIPALRSLGVRRIDRLILSHPHPDHVGAVRELASLLEIRRISATLETLRTVAGWGGWYRGKRPFLERVDGGGEEPPEGGGSLAFLWPLPEGEGGDLNDRSLVVRYGWGEGGLLLPGDIGWEVADDLAGRHGRGIRSTILKVPHHGSRHSSSPRFLDAVSPRLAVIFAGRGNRFGLPSAEALAELHVRGILLWRTDLDGTLTLCLDPKGAIHFICGQSD